MTCTTEALEALLQRRLSGARRAHSRRVAELSAELCARWALDPQLGVVAGLAHDLAREMSARQLRRLARRDGGGFSPLEERQPLLLHGRAAAVMTAERLGILDPQILEAVAWHVTGRPGMGRLARVVFVADYLEPGRGILEESRRLEVLRLDPEAMVLFVLGETFRYLRSKGRQIAAPALALYEESSRQ